MIPTYRSCIASLLLLSFAEWKLKFSNINADIRYLYILFYIQQFISLYCMIERSNEHLMVNERRRQWKLH